ncbi:MAG: hypothetical protein QGH83_01995 [Candidatus Pacebacteria bacterium]|nr:hypothetical protein [Candidatus Paceibacterota bacterium]
MANNFKNAVIRSISSDSTLPTVIYSVPDSKKAIAIELDVSNKSSAGQTVTVQIEDESQNETKDQAGTVTASDNHIISSVATDATGVLTTTNAAAHGVIVNDRVLFNFSAAPSFTNASLPPSTDAALSSTRFYYVQSIPSASTFTIAETKSAASPLSFDSTGTGPEFKKIHIADVVKDAPVPVGGALKVISGQKLVLESSAASSNDKIYAYTSVANEVDVIASVLEDVS